MTVFFDRFPNRGYVCAHRGARSIAPENTRMAMEQARLCGADLWETDVQLTADCGLVLFHDETLERTTDIAHHPEFAGRSWKITDLTIAEVSTLDAGSWFLSVDPFNTVARGDVSNTLFCDISAQKIPSLQEALHYCREYNFPLNLEIKDQTGSAADSQIVEIVLSALKEENIEDLVLISSFNHDYLRQVKELNPDIARAALVEEHHPDNLIEYLSDLGIDIYHPDYKITPPDQVRELVAAGIRVNLWTVNDLSLAKEYVAAGATAICTDWPQQLVETSRS